MEDPTAEDTTQPAYARPDYAPDDGDIDPANPPPDSIPHPDAGSAAAPVRRGAHPELEGARNHRGRLPGDEGLIVRFYKDPFGDRDLVEIRPADPKRNKSLVSDEVERYAARFPEDWLEYLDYKENHAGETPLTHVPWVDQGMRDQLAVLRVHTLEQLASLSDAALSAFPPDTRRYRDKAVGETDAKQEAEDPETPSPF